MKLLLDQNLSRRLLPLLGLVFPGSTHVVHVGMERASDLAIWDYAIANDFVIATKDRDFLERSVLLGHPPKILHIRLGNCSVEEIAALLLASESLLKAFVRHPGKSYLLLP